MMARNYGYMGVLVGFAIAMALLVGCSAQAPQASYSITYPAETTLEATAAPTTIATEAATEATQADVENAIDPMGLVGNWQRTHAEAEGDKAPNINGTLIIAEVGEALVVTFRDGDTPNFDAADVMLEIKRGALYADCGNDTWYAEATFGTNTYSMTLLEDHSLLFQLTFDFDGQPMVSTQWFAAAE